jgi:hypothetical protein
VPSETPLFKIPLKLARQLTISAPPKALYASGAPPYMAIFYGGKGDQLISHRISCYTRKFMLMPPLANLSKSPSVIPGEK